VIISRRALLACLATAGAATAVRAEPLPLIPLPGHVAAPDFALPDLNNKTHRLADYRGRPLLVSFWAVWCPSCRKELSALAALRQAIGADVTVLTIDVGDSDDRVREFLDMNSVSGLTVLRDIDKSVATAWHVIGLPCAYGVSADGQLRLGALGARDWTAPAIEDQLRHQL
jgi:peroxiredoxin